MHLTLYIQPCHFISTIMKIDKRELSYHNSTYITAGNCYFRRLQVKEMSGTEQAGRKSCLPVADQMLSMEELTVMQVEAVCRKTFFITGQIVAVIAGVLELSSA